MVGNHPVYTKFHQLRYNQVIQPMNKISAFERLSLFHNIGIIEVVSSCSLVRSTTSNGTTNLNRINCTLRDLETLKGNESQNGISRVGGRMVPD